MSRKEYYRIYREKNRLHLRAQNREYYKKNRETIVVKHRIASKKYQENNPKKVLAAQRKCKYGLTQEQHDKMYMEQLGLCAICHEPFGDETPHVDHCHKTGKIRGLVHKRHNTLLSNANDDILNLGYAIEYLVKSSSEEAKKLPHIKMTIEQLQRELHE
jgi:5-methylcytosine-specific restriction endonuclease McrA